MPAEYTIFGTQPWTYLNTAGQVVNGYRVFFTIVKFGETHYVEVPTLAPETVRAEIVKIVKQRNDLSTI